MKRISKREYLEMKKKGKDYFLYRCKKGYYLINIH